MFNNDFLFYAPIRIGVGIVAYFLFIKRTNVASGLSYYPHLIPSSIFRSFRPVLAVRIWPGKINELVGKGISYDDSFQVDGCLSERRLFSEGALSFCFFRGRNVINEKPLMRRSLP